MPEATQSRTSILSFGDSQSEVFDYVFHNDERYVKYEEDNRVGFVSGFSTRGLAKPANKARILNAIEDQLVREDLDHVVAFLAFGSVDIEWNLAFKRSVQNEHPDTTAFLAEMTKALSAVVTEAHAMAASRKGPALQLVLAFPFAPLPLPDDYIHRVYAAEPPTYDMVPRDERLELWKGFILAMQGAVQGLNIPIVDVTPVFEAQGAETFMNDDHEDHHPDFIKTQGPIASLIAGLNLPAGLAPQPELDALYAHVRRKMPKDPTAKKVSQPNVVANPMPIPARKNEVHAEEKQGASPDEVVELGNVLNHARISVA